MAAKRNPQSVAKSKRATAEGADLARVHLDLDQALWRRFKAHCTRHGWTLKARVQELIVRDMAGER